MEIISDDGRDKQVPELTDSTTAAEHPADPGPVPPARRVAIGPPPPLPKPDLAMTGRFLGYMLDPAAGCIEMRVFDGYIDRGGFISTHPTFAKNMSGWYDDADVLICDVAKLDKISAYVTVNPVKDYLLARRYNKILKATSGSTKDQDVAAFRWLFIDIDAPLIEVGEDGGITCSKRPDDISSTHEELAMAVAVRDQILADHPELARAAIWGKSGNGAWIFVRLPDYEIWEGRDLAERALDYLAGAYGGDCEIDQKCKNPSRVGPIPGTLKCKGAHIAGRPWRLATLDCPDGWTPELFDLKAWLLVWEPEPQPEQDDVQSDHGDGQPTPHGTPTPGRRGPLTVEERARRWLAKVPPAISGQRGHDKTFYTACQVGPGFGLDEEVAVRLIRDDYNPQCDPEWSEKEIRHKVHDAYKVEPRRGWKLNVPPNGRVSCDGPAVSASSDGEAGGGSGRRHRFAVGERVVCFDRPDMPDNSGTVVKLIFRPFGYRVHWVSPDGTEATKFVAEQKCSAVGGPATSASPVDWSTLSDEDLGMRRASKVKRKPIKFLLPGRIPEGDYTLVAGRGKQGKSLFTMAVGTKVSTGGEWWDGSGTARSGHVFILSAEDDAERVIAPRLKALGADLDRITILEAKYKIRPPDGKPPLVSFTSLQDLTYWREVFSRVDGPVLMIIDPLPSYVGKGINDRRNNDVRAILGPFIDLVKEFGMTLLGVTHFGKAGDARTAADKILDSVAYANLARAIHYVSRDPDQEERVLVMPGECSYSKRSQGALAFNIIERTIADDEGGQITIGVPEFEVETVEVDPDDIVTRQVRTKGGTRGPDPSATTKLAEWLVEFLKDRGPITLGEIAESAGQAGHLGSQKWNPAKERNDWTKFTTLYRAADAVTKLDPPLDGWKIATSKQDPNLRSVSGAARWALIREDSPS